MSKIKQWFFGFLYSFIGCINCLSCIATIIHFIDMIHSTGAEFIESFLGFVCGVVLIMFLPYWFGGIIKNDWKE